MKGIGGTLEGHRECRETYGLVAGVVMEIRANISKATFNQQKLDMDPYTSLHFPGSASYYALPSICLDCNAGRARALLVRIGYQYSTVYHDSQITHYT